jgi:hypothetical protein
MNQKIVRTGIAMIILCCLSSFIGLQIQMMQPKVQCEPDANHIASHDTLQFSVKDGCLTTAGKNDKINVLFLLW